MDVQPSLGLALGGGGARGGAHIGLLKVLDREGIRVGPIAGTSVGGVIGGLYAAGLSGAEIEDLLGSMNPSTMLEIDLSGWSLFSTHRFFDFLRQRVGDVQIEHLPHPFAAVAVDLRACREVSLTQGPLATAMQATMAMPGILCPVDQGDSLLVDGAVLNSVPVSVARSLGAGWVLAVDLGTPLEAAPLDLSLDEPRIGLMPGLLPRLLGWLLSRTGRRTAAALGRSFNILSSTVAARRLQDDPPDLLLRPEVAAIPTLDLARLPEAVAIGQRLAEERLPEIRRLASQAAPAALRQG